MSALARGAQQFRILWPEEGREAGCGEPRPTRAPRGDPRLAWRWGEFFANWFVPGILRPKQTAQGTIDLYGDALRYWAAITGDSPIGETFDLLGIDFVEQLPEWGYARRGVRRGESPRICRLTDTPAFWPLARTTMAAHASRMATLFRRAGPRYDPREKTAELLTRVPLTPEITAEFQTKGPFSLAVARQIYAAARLMRRPELPAGRAGASPRGPCGGRRGWRCFITRGCGRARSSGWRGSTRSSAAASCGSIFPARS